MASLKELKIRIGSVKSTQKITKAKQMVAAAKLRKAQAAAEAARPYSSRLEAVVASLASKIAGGSGEGASPLLANSDRGLAGAFNANIVKAARAKADELIQQGKTVRFYLIGRKGRPVINRTFPGMIVAQFDTTGAKEPGFDQASAIAHELTDMYLNGKFDVAHLFYSQFKSALAQIPTEQQIIPVKIPADADRNAIDRETGKTYAALVWGDWPEKLKVIDVPLVKFIAPTDPRWLSTLDAITTELVEIISGAEAL